MTDSRTTVKVSPTAASYVRAGTPREDRLKAARGEVALPHVDIPVVLYFLSRDPDPEIRAAAGAGLQSLSTEILLEICSDTTVHPRILELLARLHGNNPEVVECITLNPAVDEQLLHFLAERGVRTALIRLSAEHSEQSVDDAASEDEPEVSGEGEESEEEEYLSKYQLAQEMGVSDKIKMALTGDKEWRMLLIKDTNKLVSGSVIKNPRITEAEILTICKSPVNNDDILREICINKEWTKNYQIKKALVENGKTPLHSALRFLGGLSDKDLGMLAKSKNVSSVISTQARRLLMNKKKEK